MNKIEKLEKDIFDMIILYKNVEDGQKEKYLEKFNNTLEDQLKDVLDKVDLNRLNFRKEKRGYFDFFLSMYEKTQTENNIMLKWKAAAEATGLKVDLIHNGIDNNGCPVLKSTKKFRNSDYIVYVNGEKFFYDLKISPTTKCFTFKISDLKNYIKNNIKILLVLTDDLNLKYWSVLSDEFVNMMIDNKVGIRGKHFGFFKETQRVYRVSDSKALGYADLEKQSLISLNKFI